MISEDRIYSIRPAVNGDELAISKVHIQSWQEAYQGLLADSFLQNLPNTLERRVQNWKNALAHSQRWIFVVDSAEGIVGFACFQPPRDADRPVFGELSAIYLLQKYKGCKAGFAMLNAGFQRLKDEGYKKAYCWVLENNPTISFYERTGARFSEKIKQDEIAGQKVNELEYQWSQLDFL